MDFPNIPVAQEDWLPTINSYFKKISDAQPWPGSWYKGTWGSGFTSDDVPSLFTYRLSDRLQLVLLNQQIQSVGTQAAYSVATVANFTDVIPTPYMYMINDTIGDIATESQGKLSVSANKITLTTGGQALSSGHIFISTAWLAYK